MAKKQSSSRRTPDKRGPSDRQGSSRRGDTEVQAPPRRNQEKQIPPARSDVVRCESCGEDYSITYKRCPFCDERPGRSGISGRRVSGGGAGIYGGSVHPIQAIGLVVSLVLIIAALFIVFKYAGPLLFNSKDPGAGSSTSTSQSGSQSSSQTDPGASASAPDPGSGSAGDVSQPITPAVTVSAIQLDKTDFTLRAGEEYQIIATVAPAGSGAAVTWTSSDPSALTVDADGIVKNVNSGASKVKVTVTATAGDKSAECTVYCNSSGASTGTPPDESITTTPSGTGTSAGPVAANTPGTIVNAGSGLNIRSGPGSQYEKVASAANGANITILEDTGSGWYRIDYGGGKTGYVSSDYVSVGG